MKSGRQRRTEIIQRRKVKQAVKQAKKVIAGYESATSGFLAQCGASVPVNPANLRPNNSYGVPAFVRRGLYIDRPFTCKHCGVAQIWTAKQQRWWYEVLKGDVWQIAVLCRPCRKKERERKMLARRNHFEGMANRIPTRYWF
jgi:Probable zinc-ribbon domain